MRRVSAGLGVRSGAEHERPQTRARVAERSGAWHARGRNEARRAPQARSTKHFFVKKKSGSARRATDSPRELTTESGGRNDRPKRRCELGGWSFASHTITLDTTKRHKETNALYQKKTTERSFLKQAERSGAKRSEAKRSGAERAERSGADYKKKIAQNQLKLNNSTTTI